MEVVGGKITKLGKLVPVKNGDGLALPFNEALGAKLLYHSVGMHGRDAAGIGDIGLPARNRKTRVLDQTYDLEPKLDFAEQMSNPGDRLTGSDVDYPFPKNRRVDQGLAPKRVRQSL